MQCPNCKEEMDPILAEEGVCSECGEEFDAKDLKREYICSECDEETDEDDLEDGVCSKCRQKKGWWT